MIQRQTVSTLTKNCSYNPFETIVTKAFEHGVDSCPPLPPISVIVCSRVSILGMHLAGSVCSQTGPFVLKLLLLRFFIMIPIYLIRGVTGTTHLHLETQCVRPGLFQSVTVSFKVMLTLLGEA